MSPVLLPVLIPFVTALLTLTLARAGRWRRLVTVISAVIQFGVGIWLVDMVRGGNTLVVGVGGWPAPYGIVLVADPLSAILVALGALIALTSVLYSCCEISVRLEHPLRLPLIQFLVLGMNLAFVTGDLFNLYVAFEILLLASYALLTLEADNWHVKMAFPYVAINFFGSIIFLILVGMVYSLFGTLNMAEIAHHADALSGDPRLTLIAMLIFLVAGIKAAIFPLYYWLPDSYATLPAPVAALFAGMLTKVGVYVFMRFYGTILPHDLDGVYTLVMWIAGPTMILGVIGAVAQSYIRAILPFHSLSQIGFMALAIGFFTPYSFAACLYFMVHHSLVKSSLFLVGGAGTCLNGSDDLSRMGNLWRLTPWLGVLFLFQAMSLAGIPPLSGFWAKYLVVIEGLQQGQYLLVAAAVAVGILTLLSMLKIWLGAFWNENPDQEVYLDDPRWRRMTWVILIPTAAAVALGLGAEYFVQLVREAGEICMDRQHYIDAVLSWTGRSIDF